MRRYVSRGSGARGGAFVRVRARAVLCVLVHKHTHVGQVLKGAFVCALAALAGISALLAGGAAYGFLLVGFGVMGFFTLVRAAQSPPHSSRLSPAPPWQASSLARSIGRPIASHNHLSRNSDKRPCCWRPPCPLRPPCLFTP